MSAQATAPKSPEEPVIEVAKAEDAPTIKRIVDDAYTKYIERMGMIPAPMKVAYEKLVEMHQLYVLRIGTEIVGSIVLATADDSVAVNSLVVAPSAQGRGYGRLLMKYAENSALDAGLGAVTLFTNEKMWENIALYTKLGFTETGRRTEDGFNRVYFRKELI